MTLSKALLRFALWGVAFYVIGIAVGAVVYAGAWLLQVGGIFYANP